MANLDQAIKKLNQDSKQALDEATPEAASRLSTILEELGAVLREYTQNQTKAPMAMLIGKLDRKEVLTQQDKDLMKLWIVGDAEAYVEEENNLKDWIAEVGRIIDEITRYQGQEIDVPKAFALRALLRDGSRVLADVFYFLEERERIQKFLTAMEDITDQDRQILIRLLEQKMKMEEF